MIKWKKDVCPQVKNKEIDKQKPLEGTNYLLAKSEIEFWFQVLVEYSFY